MTERMIIILEKEFGKRQKRCDIEGKMSHRNLLSKFAVKMRRYNCMILAVKRNYYCNGI